MRRARARAQQKRNAKDDDHDQRGGVLSSLFFVFFSSFSFSQREK
jgi:hypothetical protein